MSRELSERVRSGVWMPDSDAGDRQQLDAMAARGYYEAFQIVEVSVGRDIRPLADFLGDLVRRALNR